MKQFEKDGHKIFLGDALSILENNINNKRYKNHKL